MTVTVNRNRKRYGYTDNFKTANLQAYNKVRTSFSKSTIRHQGPILWNKLTPLPPLRTIKSFNKYMKRLLLTSNY